MPADWRAVPDATEMLPDGTRREWACRDLTPDPPAAAPVPVQIGPDDVECDPPNRPGHGWRHRRASNRGGASVSGSGIGFDAQAQLRIDNEQAGREFQRTTVNTAKRLGIWQWVVLVFGLGSIGWGAWVSIRAGAGEYPQTQPAVPNARSRSDRADRSDRGGGSGSGAGRGTNHCREVLVEWLRTGQIGSMTDEEIEAARRAVEADR